MCVQNAAESVLLSGMVQLGCLLSFNNGQSIVGVLGTCVALLK